MTTEFRFSFPDEHALVFTGATARYKANLAALATLKELEQTRNEPTWEQLQTLSYYTGWGDSQVHKQAFPDGNHHDTKAHDSLAAILDKAEQLSVEDSILNAHYTSLPIIKAMYDALLQFGLRSTKEQPLRILEPAGGAGNFIGMMPAELRAHSKISVVEMDALSCRVMEQLYSECFIYQQKLEECYLPPNSFDLIISNVPFAGIKVVDPEFIKPKYLKQSLHDYYFARAVQLAKPGGIIAFITSRFTLDKAETQVRKFLAENTELLALTRLPSTAFQQNAGTEVVTDIIILRKKTDEERTAQYYAKDEDYPDWVRVGQAEWITHRNIFLNQRIVAQPELIAGTPTTKVGQHYMRDFTVEPFADRELGATLTDILTQQLPTDAFQYVANKPRGEEEDKPAPPPTEGLVKEPLRDKRFTELIAAVYHQAKALLDEQARNSFAEGTRARLQELYDEFRQTYGAINAKANGRRLESDHPCVGLLSALEEPDTFAPSALFTGQTIRGEAEQQENLTPMEALSLCLNRYGRIKLDFLTRLLDRSEAEILTALAERIYETAKGELELAETFLAGNVRQKFQQYKRQHPKPTPEQQRAITALEKAIPAWIAWREIGAKLGSPWIPPNVIEEFVKEVLDTEVVVRYFPAMGTWTLSHTNAYSVEATKTWGTNRMNALDLLENGLNLRTPRVMDKRTNPERYVLNQTETIAAQAKLAELKLKFRDWLPKDSTRVTELETIYNETHNNFVEPNFDGSHLTLPGLSLQVKPRSHQKDMTWRIILSEAALAAHEGGAGKTGEAIMAAMEMRRLGLAKKPVVVVPNGLTKQWAEEARMFYPGMKVYAPDKESLSAKQRAKLLARIATSDFDLLILPFTALTLLPMKPETIREHIVAELQELEDYLREEGGKTPKQIKRTINTLQAKLKTIESEIKRDDKRTITFEETGIDFLILDEAHYFKNLGFTTKCTRVAGMPNTNSQRAFDLYLKTQHLRKASGKILFLTATPVSNSIVEAYTFQRYLQLDAMKEMEIAHFDAWVQTYAETSETLEMKPDCSGFRMVTRLSKFTDLPELRAFWSQTLDIKTSDQLQLERPSIIGGKPEIVTIPQSPELKDIIGKLAERAAKLDPRTPEKDNMLLITTDGRKAALDVRLYKPHLVETKDSKMKTCAEKVAAIYQQYEAEKGTQLIFCDIGTPRPRELKEPEAVTETELADDTAEEIQEALLHTSFYEGLRQKLVQRGIPRAEIAFIHEAKTAADKAKLFGRMKTGEIRVLVGSTSKCGVGMNAQDKVIAIHHLDSPWRPTDIDQRNWRGLRPGNQFKAIHIFVYVTENSFDAYTWGILENKVRSISQLMAPVVTARTAEDVSDVVLDAAQIKAIASGNPRILEKVATETELARLERVYSSWEGNRNELRYTTQGRRRSLTYASKREATLQQLLAHWKSHQNHPLVAFKNDHRITLDPKDLKSFFAAQAEIAQALSARRNERVEVKLAEAFGLRFSLSAWHHSDRHSLTLQSIGESEELEWEMPVKWSVKHTIEHVGETLQETLQDEQKDIRRLTSEIAKGEEELARGWGHAETYRTLQLKLAALNAELTADNNEGEAKEFMALSEEATRQDATVPTSIEAVEEEWNVPTEIEIREVEPMTVAETNELALAAPTENSLTPFFVEGEPTTATIAITSPTSSIIEPVVTTLPATETELPGATTTQVESVLPFSDFALTKSPKKRAKPKFVDEHQLSLF